MEYLIVFAATFLTATIGGVASVSASDFYGSLAKPSWAPPAGAFGPAWTVLYLLMAFAAILVWQAGGPQAAALPLALYGVQLALNALWTWVFFRWRLGAWALFEMALLWIAVLAAAVLFWGVRPLAGALMLPYLAWLTYAACLNAAVWRMNPGKL